MIKLIGRALAGLLNFTARVLSTALSFIAASRSAVAAGGKAPLLRINVCLAR